MDRLLIALGIAVVAALMAIVLRRRTRPDAPTRAIGLVPEQLDRADFTAPGTPWLVAVFTSTTCSTCSDVVAKAEVLASADVTVEVVEFQARPDLHQRYHVEAVPMLLIADERGVVRGHFLGPVTATDLWAAVAAARGDP
jgi:Thioredoxin domain